MIITTFTCLLHRITHSPVHFPTGVSMGYFHDLLLLTTSVIISSFYVYYL